MQTCSEFQLVREAGKLGNCMVAKELNSLFL